MRLIEAIREAREGDFTYLAVDEDNEVYGYTSKPKVDRFGQWTDEKMDELCIGFLILKCNWEDTLIKLEDIKCY